MDLLSPAALLIAATLAFNANAQKPTDTKGADAKTEKTADSTDLPPLPADKTVKQSATIGGRSINYVATVGSIPVRDEKGKKIAEVVFTSYVVPGDKAERPVTFAFNGGPGASSVYLNFGAVGPQHLQFGAEGDVPSDPAVTTDNPNSWLDFTDLVFIDPVGTGFSRSLVDKDETRKDFYSSEPDIKYLSRVVYDWLLRNKRLRSPKYVMGESYGGYRAPRIAYALQTEMGVGVNGIVMVSPYLDPAAVGDGTALSPLPWMIDLPSMAAAKLEREGQLNAQTIGAVEDYTRNEFVTDLLKGPKDAAARQRLVTRVSAYTGLDTAIVSKLDGRVDAGTFLREIHRKDKKIGSWYDSNVTAWDPFPASADRRSGDPILDALLAPTTSAMVDFVTRVVGWDIHARYYALSEEVNREWKRGAPNDSPVSDLRKAIANDPKMGVMIAHGYDDLACPFFGSRLIVDQMPRFGVKDRVKLDVYPGGHMFYSRPASAAAFKTDARALFRQ
jgi:carboxypeptidase C (cathepsin A)